MKKCLTNPRFAEDVALKQFVDQLPASFLNGGTSLWNGRNKIKAFPMTEVMEDGNRMQMVVKRFKRPGPIQKIVYSIRKHKARKAFENGMQLIERGFSTPSPIACVEDWKGPFLSDAYYICGSTSLPCIESQTDRDDWNKELAQAFGRFVAQLHDKGVLHHDLNDTNVLFEQKDDNYSFTVIDINRMKFFPLGEQIPMDECLENLTRFTGRIDLFEYVMRAYAEARHLDVELWANKGVEQKRRHDRNWYRRKRLLHPFKAKYKNQPSY